MSTVKEEVTTLIGKLPDTCTYEDVQYHLYILEKVHKGLEQAEKGQTISQEEIEARYEQWLGK
jgi:predicted transcriptional regulator